MYVCSSCGKTFTEPTNFCNNCGNAVTNRPAPSQYSVPYTSAPPASRGKNIAGMIMGISGMVLALIGFLYCMIQIPNAVDGYHCLGVLLPGCSLLHRWSCTERPQGFRRSRYYFLRLPVLPGSHLYRCRFLK